LSAFSSIDKSTSYIIMLLTLARIDSFLPVFLEMHCWCFVTGEEEGEVRYLFQIYR